MASPVRVLVADDDGAIVRTICDLLAAHGHLATGAASGQEVVDRVSREEFGCLLMDVRMPGVDGFAALQTAKALRPALPVVLMSGCATEEQAARATALGAWALLQKPLDPDHLLWFLSLVGKDADVLAVGDDPAFGRSLGALLEGTRFHVEVEREPGRVLARMEAGYKLAVLLDLEHAGARGADVVEAVCARYPTKPVLMIAGPGEAADAIPRGLWPGAHVTVSRPLGRERLVAAMEEIRRSKLAAALGEPPGAPRHRREPPGAGGAR
jgi:DNA-binding NtrC family response regulator